MSGPPASWVVQHRAPWHATALLLVQGVVGLFVALVCLGAVGGGAWRAWHGAPSLAATGGTLATARTLVVLAFGLWLGLVALRSGVGSLLDLLGAEVVLHGPLEARTVHRGARSRTFLVTVNGQRVELDDEVYGTLAAGDAVWMRVGRFQRLLKELRRPPADVARAARIAAPP
ncbi:MAG: hypothetical protein U0325_33505 [Polyangiales bacterium]